MKATLVSAWERILQDRLQSLSSSQDAARSGTRVDGEHRPSNRGERAAVTSQGYLAHGLGARAMAIREHLEHLGNMGDAPRTEVVVGALLTLRFDDGPISRIILLPGGDATMLEADGESVQVLSASSPIAQQLRDAVAGDALEIDRGGRFIEVELIAIA